MSSLAATIAETQVRPGHVMAWWLSGTGFVLKTPLGTQVYIDPYFSNCVAQIFGVERAVPPPVPVEEAQPDLVVATHWHEDHLDPAGLPILARRSPTQFLCPPSCRSRLLGWLVPGQRVTAFSAGQTHTFRDVRITAVPARHVAGISGLERHGLDISAPSIELAAKASPDVLFVVANADRFLPYADQAFDFVTSIDARVNALEFERVLRKGGLILVAVPAPDDLIELREQIQGGKVEKSRAARIEEELGKSLRLADRTTVRESRTFEPPVLRDLLTATYRGFRQSERAAVERLGAMSVTLAHDVLVFEHRDTGLVVGR